MSFLSAWGLSLGVLIGGSTEPIPPKTPAGLAPCVRPLAPEDDLPRTAGETIRYLLDVEGLSVGKIDFRVERRGTYADRPVTEYRSLFKLDALVASLIPIEGRAAALVPEGGYSPSLAMNRYTIKENEFEESQTFAAGGLGVRSRRTKNGKPSEEERAFPGPAQDFVSAFYVLRRLSPEAAGCTIVYGNQRAYTVWLQPDGVEKVMTPVGPKPARRYAVTFASEKAKAPSKARLWIGDGPDRLPYRAELLGPRRLDARIHLYEMGK